MATDWTIIRDADEFTDERALELLEALGAYQRAFGAAGPPAEELTVSGLAADLIESTPPSLRALELGELLEVERSLLEHVDRHLSPRAGVRSQGISRGYVPSRDERPWCDS